MKKNISSNKGNVNNYRDDQDIFQHHVRQFRRCAGSYSNENIPETTKVNQSKSTEGYPSDQINYHGRGRGRGRERCRGRGRGRVISSRGRGISPRGGISHGQIGVASSQGRGHLSRGSINRSSTVFESSHGRGTLSRGRLSHGHFGGTISQGRGIFTHMTQFKNRNEDEIYQEQYSNTPNLMSNCIQENAYQYRYLLEESSVIKHNISKEPNERLNQNIAKRNDSYEKGNVDTSFVRKDPIGIKPLNIILQLSPEAALERLINNESGYKILMSVDCTNQDKELHVENINDRKMLVLLEVLAHASKAKYADSSLSQFFEISCQKHFVNKLNSFCLHMKTKNEKEIIQFFRNMLSFLKSYIDLMNWHASLRIPNLVECCILVLKDMSTKYNDLNDMICKYKELRKIVSGNKKALENDVAEEQSNVKLESSKVNSKTISIEQKITQKMPRENSHQKNDLNKLQLFDQLTLLKFNLTEIIQCLEERETINNHLLKSATDQAFSIVLASHSSMPETKSIYKKCKEAESIIKNFLTNGKNASSGKECFRESITLYSEALNDCNKVGGDNVNFYLDATKASYHEKKFEKAIMYASTAIAIDKSNIEAYTLRGKCHEELGNLDSLEKAIEDFLIVCNRNKTKENCAMLNNIRNVFQKRLQECSEVAINAGEYQEALIHLNKALQIETEDENTTASLYYTMASAHAKEKNFEMAIMYASTAIDIDTSNIEAYTLRGKCHEERGNLDSMEKAIEDFVIVYNSIKTKETCAMLNNIRNVLNKKLQECSEVAINAGEYQEALIYLNRALQIETEDENTTASLYYTMASVHAKEECYEEAITDLKSCLEINKEDCAAYHLRAQCYQKLGNYENAIKDLGILCEQNPTVYNTNNYQSAKQELQKTLYNDVTNALKMQKYNQAYLLCNKALAIKTKNKRLTAEIYYDRAAAAYELKRYHEAFEDASFLLQNYPDYSQAYFIRAKCYEQHEMYEEAISDYQSLYINESSTENYDNLENAKLMHKIKRKKDGNIAYKAGKLDEAIKHYNQALEIKTTNKDTDANIYYNRALTFYHKRMIERAMQDLITCIEQDSQYVKAYKLKAKCYEEQEKFTYAKNVYSKIDLIQPCEENIRNIERLKAIINQKSKYLEGKSAFDRKDYNEALSILSEAVDIESENQCITSKIYYQRAYALYRLKKYNQSIEDCSTALELNSMLIKSLQLRARCYCRIENYTEAVKDFETFFEMDPTEENEKMLDSAMRNQPRDHYSILGLSYKATKEEILKAYRTLAKIYHPDKHSSANVRVKKRKEEKFKDVLQAYTVLSNPSKRAAYNLDNKFY
ncbi:unnamed protein product [Meganyctiphanes norvegica]|uniref:J domain-containing protein n=1 Tax=Meganyctiphanes norvegica TaxID=48144 RepID=A0AAV2Q2V0_MEGNR